MPDLNSNESKMITNLSMMPFIDREEIAFLSDVDYNSVSRTLRELESKKLIGHILHTTPHSDPSERFFLTRNGVRLFIRRSLVNLADTTLPITREWYTRLLLRLDIVRMVYRIARSFVPADRDTRRHTPRVIWYRDGNWDAALLFNDGNVVPILFHGEPWRRARFMERLKEFNDYHKGHVGGVLLVAPDLFSANKALFKLRSLDTSIVAYACVESEIGKAESTQRIWLGMRWGNERYNAHELLRSFGKRGRHLEQRPVVRACLPWVKMPDDLLAWSTLKQSAKRYFSIIGKCPLIRVEDLQAIAGVKLGMHKTNMAALANFDLVNRHELAGARRLSRSDEGIRLVAQRDRMKFSKKLLDRKSSSLREDGKFRGTQLRQAARTLRHNDNVHMLIGLFAEHAREENARFEFDVAQHLHRRYLDHENKSAQLSPDAQLCLYGTDYFYIEVEFTADESETLKGKLRPYIRYFLSRKWADDLRVEPTVLFVLGTPGVASAFMRIAYDECRRAGVYPALGVTDIETIEREKAVSKEIWLTRATLRSGRRYSLAENRYFSG